nr:MAG TPA: hypothetical protein [Bacteriophage sp.]
MSSKYTDFNKLDLYEPDSVPNLLAEYNSSINKIDTILHKQDVDVTTANGHANEALQKNTATEAKVATLSSNLDSHVNEIKQSITTTASTINGTITTLDSKVSTMSTKLDETTETANAAKASAETNNVAAAEAKQLATQANSVAATAKQTADSANTVVAQANAKATEALQSKQLIQSVAAKFPLQNVDIKDGTLETSKFATSTMNALLSTLQIRCFDSTNSNADNDEMVCPSGITLRGFYIPTFDILCIYYFDKDDKTELADIFGNRQTIKMPNYVKKPTANYINTGCMLMKYVTGNDFKGWDGLYLTKNGFLGTGSNIDASTNLKNCGASILPMRTVSV